MAVLLNVVALAIVLALCWAVVSISSRKSRLVITQQLPPPVTGYFEEPCDGCEGVGAGRIGREIVPCHACQGTGVQPAHIDD